MSMPPQTWLSKTRSWLTSRLTQISAPTRSIMYKLWFLLAVDSLADGMVPYSLTNYYMDIKFHPAKSTLGDVTSISYFIGSISSAFAGPLARKIGLINTMVFTHVPSSTAVLLFPFPPVFWLTAALLLVRTGLNNMDQAPRSAFIAAVVKPEERTAVMGITSMLRTLAALMGPTLTGWLAASEQFWIAFVVAGVCRLAYDFGLYAMFVNMKLYQQESKGSGDGLGGIEGRGRERDEEEVVVEMESLVDSDSGTSSEGEGKIERVDSKEDRANRGLLVLAGNESVRGRSPHRVANVES
jgi:MFS family permease